MRKMTKISLLIALLFSYSTYGAKVKVGANEMLLLSSGVGNKFFHYKVKKNEISTVPSWDGQGEPLLSNKDVTYLVLSKHKELNGHIESTVKKVSLSSKKTFCKPEQKCPEILWYYKVKVRGEKRATYVVLINGEFVEPSV